MRNSPVDLPYLPDDLLLNCIARVSRLYYPILSLVSKRFRSLVASPELYETRTLLGHTENFLYMSLRSESDTRWFTLCRRPTRIPNPNPNPNLNSRWFTSCFRPILTNLTSKEEKKFSQNLMVSVPTCNYSPQFGFTSTTIGSNIYMIGGPRSSRIFFLDCRSHTWHEAPSMRVARKFPLLNVLDGKIHVVEDSTNSSNLMESFDPKTQIWEHVPSPSAEIRGSYIFKSLVLDGKLYLFGDTIVVYKPKENIWEAVGMEKMILIWVYYSSSCVIDSVLYCFSEYARRLLWYDSEVESWRFLMGLKELPKLSKHSSCVKLVEYGGKIALLLEKKVRATGSNKKMIWCAEISLERRNAHEIYGKIEWCDVVLTIPKSCSLLHFHAVTV